GVGYTVATGLSTLVGRWHRPSDVVAAVLVVLVWAGIASGLSRREWVSPGHDTPRETVAVSAGLVVLGIGAAVGALLALQRTLASRPTGLDTRAELLTAYGGGALGVVSVT